METEIQRASASTGWARTLTTRDGVVMTVRPVLATDEAILQALFERITPADLRFRFLSAMRHVDHARIADMVHVDYVHTVTFIAFDTDGVAIATAMLAADKALKDAEVAISVRSDMKGRGVGWSLLQHVLTYGRARGFASISSVESRQNGETIAVERDAGFTFRACEGDSADVVATISLARTAS